MFVAVGAVPVKIGDPGGLKFADGAAGYGEGDDDWVGDFDEGVVDEERLHIKVVYAYMGVILRIDAAYEGVGEGDGSAGGEEIGGRCVVEVDAEAPRSAEV